MTECGLRRRPAIAWLLAAVLALFAGPPSIGIGTGSADPAAAKADAGLGVLARSVQAGQSETRKPNSSADDKPARPAAFHRAAVPAPSLVETGAAAGDARSAFPRTFPPRGPPPA